MSTLGTMDETPDSWEGDDFGQTEHPFDCPWCVAPITMLLDLSVPEQAYVEDCEVCCRPIQVSVRAERGTLASFEAMPLE